MCDPLKKVFSFVIIYNVFCSQFFLYKGLQQTLAAKQKK